jgi:alpha-D-ribose 1-methylphosphonate 5-triphosphate synthase subunit PhnG
MFSAPRRSTVINRSRRTRILIEGSGELRSKLSGIVASRREIASVEDPRGALVMVKARETAKNSLFYMGELLVTEAKVRVEGRIGIGIIAGDRPEAALELAIVDAAIAAGLDETAGWEALLLEEEAKLLRREAGEAARIARTRVAFESMDRE